MVHSTGPDDFDGSSTESLRDRPGVGQRTDHGVRGGHVPGDHPVAIGELPIPGQHHDLGAAHDPSTLGQG